MPTFNEDVVVNGRIGILSTNPAGKMEIKSPWGDWLFLRQDRNTDGGGFHIHNPWGNSNQPQGEPNRNRLEIGYHSSNGTDLWGQLVIHGPTGNVGIGTVQPTEKLHVNGNIRVSGDIFLGNADCAEEFAVENLSVAEPGMVMVLKDDETVCPSEKPYDRTAIGIVSGAGHYKPGIILNKKDDGIHRVPIAIMGRVLCKSTRNMVQMNGETC